MQHSYHHARRPRVCRAPIACLRCRQHHLKCDTATPVCARCYGIGIQCIYPKSRRGRPPRQRSVPLSQSQSQSRDSSVSTQKGAQTVASTNHIVSRQGTLSPAASWLADSTVASEDNGIRSLLLGNLYVEPLIELYYDYFHGSHPCVLPAQFLRDRRISNDMPGISLLLSVMRLIGSLYSGTMLSGPLEDEVKCAIAQEQPWTSGFEVQALVLYSIAAFCCDNSSLAKEMLSIAATKAIASGMNLKAYAIDNSGGDTVLAESWRRTWWQIYITDIHMTTSNHETQLYVSRRDTIITVDLPCEEDEYSSGNIPQPRTIDEYDYREFAVDEDSSFSSYAYLIGLLRSLDLSIFGLPRSTEASIQSICSNTDETTTAWLLLLPKNKRKLLTDNGSLDELLFKANSLLQLYTIDTHRQLSTLAFDPIEASSSFCPRPPLKSKGSYYTKENIHTAKILCAIENMTNLLILPTKVILHTPFTICMVTTITIAHLSACKCVLNGEQLQTARERIRVAIGALEAFAEVWPRGKRALHELKIIAREVLHLSADARSARPVENKLLAIIPSEESALAGADYSSSMDSFCFVGGSWGDTFGLRSFFPPGAVISAEHSTA